MISSTPLGRQDISQINPDKELVQDEVDYPGLKKRAECVLGPEQRTANTICLSEGSG